MTEQSEQNLFLSRPWFRCPHGAGGQPVRDHVGGRLRLPRMCHARRFVLIRRKAVSDCHCSTTRCAPTPARSRRADETCWTSRPRRAEGWHRRASTVTGSLNILKGVTDVRDINPGAHGESALDEPRSLRRHRVSRSRQLMTASLTPMWRYARIRCTAAATSPSNDTVILMRQV